MIPIPLHSDEILSCGCNFLAHCDCSPPPAFTVTRADLMKLTKAKLFLLYTRCLSDEMSPIYWHGLTKTAIIAMFLGGTHRNPLRPVVEQDSVELTPFI